MDTRRNRFAFRLGAPAKLLKLPVRQFGCQELMPAVGARTLPLAKFEAIFEDMAKRRRSRARDYIPDTSAVLVIFP